MGRASRRAGAAWPSPPLGGTPLAEAQTAGICGRTAEVQEWILSRVTSTTSADVTDTELAGISGTIETVPSGRIRQCQERSEEDSLCDSEETLSQH